MQQRVADLNLRIGPKVAGDPPAWFTHELDFEFPRVVRAAVIETFDEGSVVMWVWEAAEPTPGQRRAGQVILKNAAAPGDPPRIVTSHHLGDLFGTSHLEENGPQTIEAAHAEAFATLATASSVDPQDIFSALDRLKPAFKDLNGEPLLVTGDRSTRDALIYADKYAALARGFLYGQERSKCDVVHGRLVVRSHLRGTR